MKILFFVFAGTIFFLYLPYFYFILSGKAAAFESAIDVQLTNVLGIYDTSRLVYIFLAGLVLEIIYFTLAWATVSNPVFRNLTILLILFEIYHALILFRRIINLSQDKIDLSQLFSWSLERISAMSFCTHAILGIILLLWP